MQSLFQYRRFGQYVEDQYHQEIAKARWRARNPPRRDKTLPATPQASYVRLPQVPTVHHPSQHILPEKKISDASSSTAQLRHQVPSREPTLRRMQTEEIFIYRGNDVSIIEEEEKSIGRDLESEHYDDLGRRKEIGARVPYDVEKDVTRAIRRGYGWSRSGDSSLLTERRRQRDQRVSDDQSFILPIQPNSPPPTHPVTHPQDHIAQQQQQQQHHNYSSPPAPPKLPSTDKPRGLRPVSHFHNQAADPTSHAGHRRKQSGDMIDGENQKPEGLISPPRHSRYPPPNPSARPVSDAPSLGTALGGKLTGIDVKNVNEFRQSRHQPDDKVFMVRFDGSDDIMNPHNWPLTTRLGATTIVALITFVVGFASSVDSAALKPAAVEFNVSKVVESLATGLFLVGFGVGSLWAGPLSETVGRNPVYIVSLSVYVLFILGSALARNIAEQLVMRFLAGCFASTPLTCAGGSMSDLWNSVERTWTFPVFALAAFAGPIMGPVAGGFIVESELGWRWTEWVTLIASWAVLGLVALFQPETYAPTLLGWKAKRLRTVTGDERYKAGIEVREDTLMTRLVHSLYRPLLLTFSEPIIMLITLYLTVIYVILFGFLNGYTFIFKEVYEFGEGVTGLCFLGIAIGLCCATSLVPFIHERAKKKTHRGGQLNPEFRLVFAMLGAPAIPISLLWMGWTDYTHITYWSPLLASVLFGYGILCVFISSYQYIIDSYESCSASALTSATLVRYVAAGGATAYAIPMYQKLGTHWTLTLLAGISALMVPVPYIFHRCGPQIRKRSMYTVM